MSTSTKTTVTATAVPAKTVTAFVKAYRSGEQSVVTKARLIGQTIHSGSTVGKVTETLRNALTAQDLIVPKSFSASVTHYNTAYVAASTLGMAAEDSVLHAMYQISTGVVKAAEREAFVTYHAANGSTPAEVVASVRALISKARSEKKASTKGEAEEAEEEIEESISPLQDLKSLLRQAGAILDLLADNSADDYAEAATMVDAFASKFIANEF